jgi:addiction module RelE/StbE family toxin
LEVVFSPAAIADIVHIRNYIGHFNPAAARQMADRIKAAALSLIEFPDRGRQREDGTRELVIIYPYMIVYDVTPACVQIIRVWHGAQKRDD